MLNALWTRKKCRIRGDFLLQFTQILPLTHYLDTISYQLSIFYRKIEIRSTQVHLAWRHRRYKFLAIRSLWCTSVKTNKTYSLSICQCQVHQQNQFTISPVTIYLFSSIVIQTMAWSGFQYFSRARTVKECFLINLQVKGKITTN